MKKLRLYIAAASVVCIFLLLANACAPRYNIQLGNQAPPPPAPEVRQDSQTLVFVALSGGGTRAAAISWKALEGLKEIKSVVVWSNTALCQFTMSWHVAQSTAKPAARWSGSVVLS